MVGIAPPRQRRQPVEAPGRRRSRGGGDAAIRVPAEPRVVVKLRGPLPPRRIWKRHFTAAPREGDPLMMRKQPLTFKRLAERTSAAASAPGPAARLATDGGSTDENR